MVLHPLMPVSIAILGISQFESHGANRTSEVSVTSADKAASILVQFHDFMTSSYVFADLSQYSVLE